MFSFNMAKYNPNRAQAAAQLLVDTSYTAHHVQRLRTAVKRPRALPFKDDLEVLNELLVIGRQNLQAMENIIALVEEKRASRNDYQKGFMKRRRARQRKFIELEEIAQSRKFSAEERDRLLPEQNQKWEEEKLRFIEKRGGPDVTWKQRNALIKEFWSLKEKELDVMLEKARAVSGGLAAKRRKLVVVSKPSIETAVGKAFEEAFKKKR